MVNKTSLKFIAGFVVIIGISLVSLYVLQTYLSPEAKTRREFERLELLYANDTYGGKTPEETLQLFIDALKAGDIELASRYFVVEKQGEWRQKILSIQNMGNLSSMVRDLERPKKKYPLIDGNESRFIFEIFNDSNQLALQIDIGRGPNGVWKIVDM